jgi:hypothetical protein
MDIKPTKLMNIFLMNSFDLKKNFFKTFLFSL